MVLQQVFLTFINTLLSPIIMEKIKNPNKVKQGKNSRASGAQWERVVRADLEEKGWIVDRWTNNVEFGFYDGLPIKFVPRDWKDLTLKNGSHYPGPCAKLIQAKPKFRFDFKTKMRIPVSTNSGFPDFISFRRINGESRQHPWKIYEVIGIEAKMNGYLDKEEKEKINWLKSNNIFSKVLVAYKTKEKNRIKVNYKEFQ